MDRHASDDEAALRYIDRFDLAFQVTIAIVIGLSGQHPSGCDQSSER
jgi:hypothetical protein